MVEPMEGTMLREFVRCCHDGWLQGWHERHAGNLTYRMRREEAEAWRPYFHQSPTQWEPLGVAAPNLGGEFFLATGRGKFFRDIALDPQSALCVAELSEAGDRYRLWWGLSQGGAPTSEFPAHLMNLSVRKEATDGACRVMYHAHTPAMTAMTYVVPLTARDITRALWQSETECPIIFPRGVGVVPWMVPGGADIALATREAIKDVDAVIWAHHGTFASGPDFGSAFGLTHAIEKAADIYMRVLSSGQAVLQTIPDEGIRAVARAFGVILREEFLA